MIILITGDFGVGKDTFADMLLKYFKDDATKILSYTTRTPRYNGEDTHIFVSKDEWDDIKKTKEIVAETWIDDSYYGTIREQFDNKYNIYVVDDIGVRDVLNAEIDRVFIVEIIRPTWCMDIDTDRLSRKRHLKLDKKIKSDFRVINDSGLQKLDTYAKELYNWIKIHDVE